MGHRSQHLRLMANHASSNLDGVAPSTTAYPASAKARCFSSSPPPAARHKRMHPLLQRVFQCRHFHNGSCDQGRNCHFLHLTLSPAEAVRQEKEARSRITRHRKFDEKIQYYLISIYQQQAVDSLPNYETFDEALEVFETEPGNDNWQRQQLVEAADATWDYKIMLTYKRQAKFAPLFLPKLWDPAILDQGGPQLCFWTPPIRSAFNMHILDQVGLQQPQQHGPAAYLGFNMASDQSVPPPVFPPPFPYNGTQHVTTHN